MKGAPSLRTAPSRGGRRSAVILLTLFGGSLVYLLIGPSARWEGILGDRVGALTPSLAHFGLTLLLFFLLPVVIIRRGWREPLRDFGWQRGDRRANLLALSWGIPLVLILAWFSAQQPEFRAHYPLFIQRWPTFQLQGWGIALFALYQLAYLSYYVGWEFFFRGFALFGLQSELGVLPALLLQAVLSTLLHLGKPGGEVIAALPGGIIFGLVALHSRSLGAVIGAHWLLGCSLDLFRLLR